MEEKRLEVTTQIKVKDMYVFLMRHAYCSMSGVISTLISVGALVLFFMGVMRDSTLNQVLLLLIGLLFTVINPLMLLFKAAQQIKLSPMFQKPLAFTVDETGILVKQDEEELQMPWEEIYKVTEDFNSIYCYLEKRRAFIFPKRMETEQLAQFRVLLRAHIDGKRCRLKDK